MSKKPSPGNSDAEFASRLEGLFDEVPLEAREVEEIMQDAGIDANAASGRILALVREVSERERLDRFARADLERRVALEKLESKRGHSRRSRAEMIAQLSRIRERYPQAVAMYRDFQYAADDDLESLLDDLEVITGGQD